jgi:hypothetical protein
MIPRCSPTSCAPAWMWCGSISRTARPPTMRAGSSWCGGRRKAGRYVGVLGDLQGPKIRIDRFVDGKVQLADGAEFAWTPRSRRCRHRQGGRHRLQEAADRRAHRRRIAAQRRPDQPAGRASTARASRRACWSAASSATTRASTARAAACPPARSPTRIARTSAPPRRSRSIISAVSFPRDAADMNEARKLAARGRRPRAAGAPRSSAPRRSRISARWCGRATR